MIRICISQFHLGNKVFGEKEPLEDREETHGFCAICYREERKKLRREIKLLKERKGREGEENVNYVR